MTNVRKATATDIDAMAHTLQRAFFDDPVIRWMLPDEDRRRRTGTFGWRSWLEILYLPKAQMYTNDEHTCAALWSPPGNWKVPLPMQVRMAPRMVRIFGGRRLPLILEGLALIEKKHPDREPHYTLGVLGTDPDHQGDGIGSALIQPVLDTCDTDGIGAYLESSTPSNVPYYRRFGFEVTEEFTLPQGPPVWGMWREPRPR